MTIPELTALSDSELTVAFYRDVLGWTCHETLAFYLVRSDGTEFSNEKGAIFFYGTESEAWLNVPPVSPEVWMAEADRLEHEDGESCDLLWDLFYKLQKHKQGTGFMPLSEALKRAVMIAAIFTHGIPQR